MTQKMFRNETPPPLTVTFESAVAAYDSVVLRFFAPNSETAVLDATVTMAGNRLSGTANLTDDDLAEFGNGVYECLPVGIEGDNETALFETPIKFLIRTLPQSPDAVS